MDLTALRDGVLDKVTHAGDRSLTLSIFADGRFGTFSVNQMDPDRLRPFIRDAVATVRMLAPDPCRSLPDPARKATDARTGLELGLYDAAYAAMTARQRLDLTCRASLWRDIRPDGYKPVSEELEYSDSISDQLVVDSEGLEARHIESSFEIGCEMTVADTHGNKYAGSWWDASPFLETLKADSVCPEALRRAVAQIGPKTIGGGPMTMVVENDVAGKLLNPLLGALGGYSVQQGNSFLAGRLGERLFPEGLTVEDRPREAGQCGAKFFDSEGVATYPAPIIRDGCVQEYFLNTYIARKMGLAPTREDALRPAIRPFLRDGHPDGPLGLPEILRRCREGILVTGFVGGNHNAATGDFSYGIDGFAFRDGQIVHPVRGMVITGNLLHLWSNLLAAGDDPRPCAVKRIPTLAFTDVEFSA